MRNRDRTKTGICLNGKDYKNCNGGAMHLWNEKQDCIMNCIKVKIKYFTGANITLFTSIICNHFIKVNASPVFII